MMAIDTTPISPNSKVILPARERLEKSDSRGMGESGSKRSLARQLRVQSPVQGTHSMAVCVHANWPKVAAFVHTRAAYDTRSGGEPCHMASSLTRSQFRFSVMYGYQVGSLVVPTLAPILVWLWLDRQFVAKVVVPAWKPSAPASPSAADPS
ncbi:exosortase H-associated membrane protein [Acidovorax temperans]|uniref:exosortase H-associated membrane protein n=1 Tax=Acidovorax temperans TaxID=80878 RepID=UPI0030B83D91